MQKLGKYEILTELGHGAMGVVYKARDPFIGRLVALKTINSNLVDRPDLLDRFHQEAQSAGKLQHPNIVTIFELGQEKETPFIAMEYLDGESLEKTIVRQADLPLALKVGFIVRICQALEYAHKNRVVHRDIKPGNIMVNSEGVVKVVDFGIARLVDFSRTHTNLVIGTPAYMAPELFRKKKADERTDIWAAGILFYELICYQRPFTGEGYDIIRGIMEDEYPAISSVVPDCPNEVEAVIERMLRKQSADRYQNMEDVLLDLEPVYNRLRFEAASVLAARGREFFDLGDLPRAQEASRRARLIDNTNAQAKSLLEKISAQFRRIEVEPKVQEHLSRSRAFLQSGDFRQAQVEVDAALGLDSRCEPAQKLGAEVEAAVARAQQIGQKLRFTKQRLAEGAITEADSVLQQALDLDATHPQALELKRQLNEEKNRRERRKQLNEVVQRARTLWTELKYEECLAAISEGLKTFPSEAELKKLQEAALADLAEQKKQRQAAEVRRLLGQQKLAEAREALDVLIREQPADSTVRNLNALLTQEEQEQKRKTRLLEGLSKLRALVSAGKLADAITKGEPLLREFPEEREIKDLVAYAKEEIAQAHAKAKEASAPVREQKTPSGSRPAAPRPPGPRPASPPPATAPRREGPEVSASAANIVSAAPRKAPSVGVMTPPPGPPPATIVQTQLVIEEKLPETRKSPVRRGFALKPAVIITLGVVLAGVVYGAVHFLLKMRSRPSVADLAMEAEAKQLWENHKPNDALADWQKLADHSGPLHDEAVKQITEIEQKHVAVEQLYAQGMKLLYEDKKYPEAAEKFNQILQMNLWKMDETRREYEIAVHGPGPEGAPPKPLWQALFDDGKRAFDKKEYATARKNMELAANTVGVSSDVTQQVHRYLPVIHDREEQKKLFDQGTQLQHSGQKLQAKELFERVIKAADGDPDLVASAKRQIEHLLQPPPVNLEAAIADVRNLISQARWDDADTKLSGLQLTPAQYNDLKGQIDAGRRDDRDFNQSKDSFKIADASKHKDVLRALRPFFMGEANRPGPHSGEARNIVEQIDADLKGPDGGGGLNPNDTTVAAIRAVLERFAKAIDEGDVNGLKAVRRYTPREESKLPKAVKSTKGKGYTLRNCSLTGLKGDAATVSCDAVLTKVGDAKAQRITFELNRIGVSWIIVASNLAN